jgi:DNA-binding response OmpR family regulator
MFANSPFCLSCALDRRQHDPTEHRPAARRVLVVDDDADAAESLALFLSLTGNEVRTAADGLAAVRLAREFRPHAVVLDLGLPGIDGCEVARRLRREAELAGVVLVALTGYSGDASCCLEAGFDCLFVKPTDPREVQKALAGQAGRQSNWASPGA